MRKTCSGRRRRAAGCIDRPPAPGARARRRSRTSGAPIHRRWRRTSPDTSSRSSTVTKSRPRSIACAWAARIQASVARGLTRGARLGAPPQPVDVVDRRALDRRRRVDERDGALPLDERLARQDRPHRREHRIGREVRVEHADLVVRRRVPELEGHHEAVDLRGRERERPLVLDGVHRREDLEGVGHPVRRPVDGHRALLHDLQQRRLRLRRGAVDLVGEEEVREDRPRAEDEALVVRLVDRRRR